MRCKVWVLNELSNHEAVKQWARDAKAFVAIQKAFEHHHADDILVFTALWVIVELLGAAGLSCQWMLP